MPDSKGNLWMTTNKGVSQFNPNTNNDSEIKFRNYDVNNGLQGMEFNQGAFFKSKSGEMFIGGVNGFNIFNPENLNEKTPPPDIKLISYKRLGKEIKTDTLIYNKKSLELNWNENLFAFEFAALDFQNPGKNLYSVKLEGLQDEWSPPSTKNYVEFTELKGGNYILKVKAANSQGIWNDEGIELYITIHPPFWKTTWFYTICIIIIFISFWTFLTYRTRNIIKEKNILEEKVTERTSELAQKNKDITSSIQYAKRIQLAILPSLDQIYKQFKNIFIFYKPKDIVICDFYWFGIKNGKKIIAMVDCTGHGVPGAFMSMIGYNLLNQIILENGITQPDLILNALHNGVQAALKQGSNVSDSNDGMDIAICSIDIENKEINYAGAYRSLYLIKNNDLIKIEANKFSIGGSQLDVERKFTNHTLKINSGENIYMYSDGYSDQFGGEKGKKFMVKRMNELLLSFQGKSFQEQEQILEETLNEWKGNLQQVDDVLVIGIGF